MTLTVKCPFCEHTGTKALPIEVIITEDASGFRCTACRGVFPPFELDSHDCPFNCAVFDAITGKPYYDAASDTAFWSPPATEDAKP